MKAVITRCSEASVVVDGEVVGELPQPGLVALIGATHEDDRAEADKIVRKLSQLRILDGEQSALDANAPILVISQFTLYGDARKGRRPSWSKAAPGEHAEPLIDYLIAELAALGLHVESGRFGAKMQVRSVNEGPFTILLDSADIA